MATMMELTDEERKIILDRRAEKAHQIATLDFQLRAIQVASNYFIWASERNFPTPDSGTFVNQFGYEKDDHPLMRDAVHKIWKLVFSLEIPKPINND